MTGQSPWWMALATAGLALLGVITGLLVNGRREERRWRRDLEREEIRWQRELEREQMHWQHEKEKYEADHAQKDLVDWRSRKIDVYAELLSAITELVDSAIEWQSYTLSRRGNEEYVSIADIRPRLIAALKQYKPKAQRAALMGTPELRYHLSVTPPINWSVYGVSRGYTTEGELDCSELRLFASEIEDTRLRVLAIMRQEIGSWDERPLTAEV